MNEWMNHSTNTYMNESNNRATNQSEQLYLQGTFQTVQNKF